VLLSSCADDSSGTWRAAHALPERRFEAKAVLAAGHIWYVGGITGDAADPHSAQESRRVDLYDPATDRWSAGPDLPADAPTNHVALAALDDRVFVLGGFTGIADPPRVFLPSAKTYVVEGTSGSWQPRADQPLARGAAAAEVIDGRIYVAGGGVDERGAVGDLFVYDPAGDAWTPRARMPTERQHLASCILGGRMLVAGGWYSEDKQVVGTAQLYDPATDTWSDLPDLPTPRGGLGAAVVGDTCYMIGGEEWHGALPGTFHWNQSFRLGGRDWRWAADMPTARHGIAVAPVAERVFVIGGGPIRGNSYTDVVEVFQP
jgi:non-specific serine/threonine protein kinase